MKVKRQGLFVIAYFADATCSCYNKMLTLDLCRLKKV